jgi:hypothetical protein
VQHGTAKIETHNNRKPVFSSCSKYNPTVKEEADTGTEVLTVQAVDRDLEDTITYTFIVAPGERLKFNINNKTGLITTKQVLEKIVFFFQWADLDILLDQITSNFQEIFIRKGSK